MDTEKLKKIKINLVTRTQRLLGLFGEFSDRCDYLYQDMIARISNLSDNKLQTLVEKALIASPEEPTLSITLRMNNPVLAYHEIGETYENGQTIVHVSIEPVTEEREYGLFLIGTPAINLIRTEQRLLTTNYQTPTFSKNSNLSEAEVKELAEMQEAYTSFLRAHGVDIDEWRTVGNNSTVRTFYLLNIKQVNMIKEAISERLTQFGCKIKSITLVRDESDIYFRIIIENPVYEDN